MKQNNYSTVLTEFSTLNQEIDRSHEETVAGEVLHLARTLACKNFPKPDEQEIEPFIGSITAKYATFKNKAAIRLKGALQKYLGSIGIGRLTKKIEEIRDKLNQATNQRLALALDRDRLQSTCKSVSLSRVWFILFLFGLAEVINNVSTLIAIGDIVLFALILGAVIGFAQVIAAKYVTLYIRDMPDAGRRKRYIRIATISFSLFSLMLGVLRYYMVSRQQSILVPFWALNPFCFAAINMVFIIGASLVTYRMYPSKELEEQLQQLHLINKGIREVSKGIVAYETEIDLLCKEKATALQFHGQLIFDEQKMYEKIDNYYLHAVGTFKTENIAKRSDNEYPDCFRKQILPPPSPQTEHFSLSK